MKARVDPVERDLGRGDEPTAVRQLPGALTVARGLEQVGPRSAASGVKHARLGASAECGAARAAIEHAHHRRRRIRRVGAVERDELDLGLGRSRSVDVDRGMVTVAIAADPARVLPLAQVQDFELGQIGPEHHAGGNIQRIASAPARR